MAASPAHHPVAVADDLGVLTLRVRRPHDDVDAGGRPASGDLGGMDLRAAGLDVIEVAPRQDVHPPQPGGGGHVAQLAAIRGDGGHGSAQPSGALRAPSGTADGEVRVTRVTP